MKSAIKPRCNHLLRNAIAKTANWQRISLVLVFGVVACATHPPIPSEYLLVPNTVSVDSTYGYTEQNPIKVGGMADGLGPDNEWEFVSNLRNIHGDSPEIERLGSCCFFKSKHGFKGYGLLDMYQLVFKPHDTVVLYLNMYDYESPMVPRGLVAAGTEARQGI